MKKHSFGPLNGYVERNGVVIAKADETILREAIKGADVVHLLVPFMMSWKSVKIASEYGIPVTASFHCQAENFSAHIFLMNAKAFNRGVYRFFYKKGYRFCDAVHYPTQFIRETFENTVEKKTNAYVISNGVNKRFVRNPVEKPDYLKDKYIILFTGRYSKEKSHKVLIDAASISKYADKIQLIFAGDGPMETKLKKYSKKKLKNAPIFKFFSREEMLEVLNFSDLYVHPAEVEIEAISCLEAITCGLVPVIADSPRSATRFFALGEENLFRWGHPESLAEKIDYWIEHPEEKNKCREKYLGFSERFEQSRCMDEMEQMLIDAAEGRAVNEQKTVFYSDPINEDFAATNGKINKKKVDEKYRYQHMGLIYKFFEFVTYRCIATPLIFIYMKLAFGLRIKNKKVIRRLRGGFFLYGNHTQNIADAFIPSLISFPRKNHIVTSPEAVSIPIVRFFTPMLGAVPIPSTVRGTINFSSAVGKILKKHRAVTIYPEAHIWPFCNFIRPFGDGAFTYPIKYGLPAVPFTVTYRKRKIFKSMYPLITVYIGTPIYPDLSVGRQAARKKLRDDVFNAMNSAASSPKNEEYIAYRQVNGEEETHDGDIFTATEQS